jgi:predicted GNAT family N-acyltransferase
MGSGKKAAEMSIERIESLSEEQIEELHRLYQLEWWTKGREREGVRRMLEHSDVIVAFADAATGKLAAFARVLTDYVYKALIFDVIVEASHRGEGLGAKLMEAIVGHPKLESVRHFELYCLPELVPFYRRWGFTDELGELRFMRRG